MFICKYCGKEFESKEKLGGHVTSCKLNPNYLKNKENIIIARKHIKHRNHNTSGKYFCRYCNKEIGNKGCLVLHEKRCKFNPNYKPTDKQLEKQNRINTKKVLSEEHKQKIRESLQRWKEENKELFLNYSRKKSICSENFKNYLRQNNIDFIEEYSPYIERLYSLDIAFPDEKIAIEINGSQHYDENGELNEYTLNKQKFFEERGWKIIQIYYKWCYGILEKNKQITNIFDLPIHNKNYVKEIYTRKYIKDQYKKQQILEKQQQEENKHNYRKEILYNMLYHSNINFTKSGWNKECIKYLKSINYPYTNHLFRQIRKYFPEFLKQDNVWKRKGSIY